jgi:gamma-glutamyltranspeptidase/glutathione hydrolase
MHTLIPAIGVKDGKTRFAFGVMGAAFQPMGHVYMMSNMLDYGLDPQEALDCPRVFFEGADLIVEEGVPPSTVQQLAMMGHSVKMRDLPWGGGQIVTIDPVSGVRTGASDPRKDGCALGY